jgi:phenylacetic acid degradation operon negative regulatory protein
MGRNKDDCNAADTGGLCNRALGNVAHADYHTHMKPIHFQDLVTCLTADQTPRVWSLLVTVFGELAQDEGSQISGALLGKLTALMGIKPEAMRVALHRLRKDGWIESTRSGRTSTYFLTDWGRAQSAEASPRIYNFAPVTAPAWLVVCDPASPIKERDMQRAWITPHIAITTDITQFSQAYATQITAQTPLPDWIRQKVCKPETLALTAIFDARLKSLKTPGTLNTYEITALRVLIVHGWRRIILRTPALPDQVFPKTWAGASCRENVAALLGQYPCQMLDQLEAS